MTLAPRRGKARAEPHKRSLKIQCQIRAPEAPNRRHCRAGKRRFRFRPRKKRERQEASWYGGELPAAPGHPFCSRLNEVLDRGKRLQSQRGERIERNFAHQFDTGGKDRLYDRGIGNVHRKLLLQAAACHLALLMRSIYGAGKPRAAHEQLIDTVSALLAFMGAIEGPSKLWSANLCK